MPDKIYGINYIMTFLEQIHKSDLNYAFQSNSDSLFDAVIFTIDKIRNHLIFDDFLIFDTYANSKSFISMTNIYGLIMKTNYVVIKDESNKSMTKSKPFTYTYTVQWTNFLEEGTKTIKIHYDPDEITLRTDYVVHSKNIFARIIEYFLSFIGIYINFTVHSNTNINFRIRNYLKFKTYSESPDRTVYDTFYVLPWFFLIINPFYHLVIKFLRKNNKTIFYSYDKTYITNYIPIRTISELKRVIQNAGPLDLSICGSRHSLNNLYKSSIKEININNMNKILEINLDEKYVWAEAGITLHNLNSALSKYGYTVPVLGTVDYQTLGGATSAGTHGSLSQGDANTSSQILELDIMNGLGEIINIKSTDPAFPYALVSLGYYGVVIRIKYKIMKQFYLRGKVQLFDADDYFINYKQYVKNQYHNYSFYFPIINKVLSCGTVVADNVSWLEIFINNCGYYLLLLPTLLQFACIFLADYFSCETILFVQEIASVMIYSLNYCGANTVSRMTMSELFSTSIFDKFNLYSVIDIFASEFCFDVNKFPKIMSNIKKSIQSTSLKPNMSIIEIRYSKGDKYSAMSASSNFSNVCWLGYRLGAYTTRTKSTFEQFEKIILDAGGVSHWAKDGYNLKWFDRVPNESKLKSFYAIKKQFDPKNVFNNQVIEQMNYK
jgi:hypothetical protein